MISADFKNLRPEADLAALLHGLRYRGLVVGPDDARKVATAFRQAQGWSHQRCIRVLQSLLARSDEERRVIDQLAPFLFVDAQRVAEDSAQRVTLPSHQEDDEPVQPRFSSRDTLSTPLLSTPFPRREREQEAPQLSPRSLKEYLQKHAKALSLAADVVVALLVAVALWHYVLRQPIVEPPPPPSTPPEEQKETDTPRGPQMIVDDYVPPPPPHWPFSLALGLAAIPLVVVVPRYWRFRQQQLNLTTLAASTGPRTYRFAVRPDELEAPLDANLVREAAFHLNVASAEAVAPWIDVHETIEQTVRNAGQLTLCFDTWREHRAVLFIEDCGPSMVRWPEVGRQIAEALARQGGTVTHYYMERTPERLFRDPESRSHMLLEQVLAGLGEPTIVLLSDAATIDPFSAVTKYAWIGLLEHAIWLHPQQVDLWGPGSRWLAERVRVVPVNDEGLQRLGAVRGITDHTVARRWRPAQVVGQEMDTRVAAMRVSLGDDTFWWLAAGAVLDCVGVLTTRTWWHLRNERFLSSLPSRENCNRVWELADVQVGADGAVRLRSDLCDALVKKLKQEQPELLSGVAAWAEARVRQDLAQLDPQTLAAVEARALLGRIQSLDPQKHDAARRTLKQLARDGFGEWVSVNENEESLLQRWRFSLALTEKPTLKARAVAAAGALCVMLAIGGLYNPEWFIPRARVVRITLNAPATADPSGKVALSWSLQEKDEQPPTQWQVQRNEQNVQQTTTQEWQDTPTGSGPLRYQVLAFGPQGEVYRSHFYDVAAATEPQPVVKGGEMVMVPAGEFFMGCNEELDKECYEQEKPGRTIDLPAFAIDKTEVTVAQFAQCVAVRKCSDKGLTMPYYDGKEQPEFAWACNWGKAGREAHPINCVDWNQAEAFCKWAGKRLPSEAEWEKAARGTDGRKYPWGNDGYGRAGKMANIGDEALKRKYPSVDVAEGYDDGYVDTAPVGSFPAGKSPYEALDMVGNVWEWAADWYDEKQTYRSLRGGSWRALPRNARASYRGWYEPGTRTAYVGCRCAQ